MTKITILGAGLAGLLFFHLGHERCVIFEKNPMPVGIYTAIVKTGVWDEGPHVSFTKHEYVRKLFEQSVQTNILSLNLLSVIIIKNTRIPHPAQSNLYAILSHCVVTVLVTF